MPTSRIGANDAEIVLFNKGGRDIRYERLQRGEEAPREFFYGFFDLEEAGLSSAMLSSTGAVPGRLGACADSIEHAVTFASNFGARPLSARLRLAAVANAKVVVSFTDGFSLSLGLAGTSPDRGPALIGGFHGLSDIENRASAWARPLARGLIRRALARLDHVFFFGPADRDFAVNAYGLSHERSSVFPFGIDTDFWRPVETTTEEFAVAVGQDLNRDYELLAAAPGRHRTIIVTRQPVRIPSGADHVTVTAGDYFGSDSMSDPDLRRIYNSACAVIVPLKDVYQPSGYSVTLQAMSCARPVVLTKTRGLWAPDKMIDGENCVLVPPGDAAALGDAIARIRSDPVLASRLGRNARQTALQHYNLDRMGAGLVELARRGLALRAGARPFVQPLIA
jgi:Glycosyl transferases group 1/Glycosyltransferase Family 4